jgi:Rps23 Pro-64 3,4-dihydroxylase Tpa1-like proline 4-hydroxylase
LLGFAREVTGDESIGWISGTATLYKPLDFLAVHAVSQVASFGGLRFSISGWFEPITGRMP